MVHAGMMSVDQAVTEFQRELGVMLRPASGETADVIAGIAWARLDMAASGTYPSGHASSALRELIESDNQRLETMATGLGALQQIDQNNPQGLQASRDLVRHLMTLSIDRTPPESLTGNNGRTNQLDGFTNATHVVANAFVTGYTFVAGTVTSQGGTMLNTAMDSNALASIIGREIVPNVRSVEA